MKGEREFTFWRGYPLACISYAIVLLLVIFLVVQYCLAFGQFAENLKTLLEQL